MKLLLTILVLNLLWLSSSKAEKNLVCDWIVKEVYADLLKEGSDDHLFVVVGKDGRCEYGRGTDKYQGLTECEKHKKVNLIDGICKLYVIGEKRTGKFAEKTIKEGEKIFGCIEGNCSNGKGVYKWDDGAKYIGEFKKHKKNGKGTFFYASGTKYVGEFQNDKYHGKGTMFWNDGVVEVAEWEYGNIVKTISVKKNFIFKTATTFVDGDIIKNKDPSNFKNVSFVEKKNILDYDKRTFKNNSKDSWGKSSFSAYIFKASFENSEDILIKINTEFKKKEKAEKLAIKFGNIYGQMPKFLRKKVKNIIVHKGKVSWAGGDGTIIIHTNELTGENKKYIEEAMIHELTHASLDWWWGGSVDEESWKKVVTEDKMYISEYAWNSPGQEDLAETVLWWYATKCKKNRISKKNYNKVVNSLPNRFKYLDNKNFDTSPSVCK